MNCKIPIYLCGLVLSISAVAEEIVERRDVRLVVTESGQYILSGKRVDLVQLRTSLRELKSKDPQVQLHVTGEPNVNFVFVSSAMQIVQQEGLAKVGFIAASSPPPVASSASVAH